MFNTSNNKNNKTRILDLPGRAQAGWAIPIWDKRKKEIKTPHHGI